MQSAMHGVSVKPVSKIWLDGKLVAWRDATVHVLTHSLHYGLAAFEGIRCYRRGDGRSAVFRLQDHLDRLLESCHVATIESPFTRDEIATACLETLRANQMTQAYLRPIIFLGDGALGLGSL